jgi:phosphatidate cytidylyltransferase
VSQAPSVPEGEAAGSPDAGPVHPRPPTPVAPRREKEPGSDLPARLLTAAVLVPTVLYVIVQGGLWTLGTVMVVILLGQREFYRLIEDKGAHPLVGFGLAAGAALPVVAYLGNEYHATVLMTATLLAVMIAQLTKAEIGEALSSISGTFFGVFYVGWLLSHAVPLREFHGVVLSRSGASVVEELGIAPEAGIYYLIFTLTVVVWCDAGAYFAGRTYGKRKLAPRISPGKTVEGAIGGIIIGVLGGLATKSLFDFFWPALSVPIDWVPVLVFAAVLAVVAIVGDLVESLLKRDAERKDAGRLLPGMGGVLDRIDSPLLAIPVMYYMLLFYVFLRTG